LRRFYILKEIGLPIPNEWKRIPFDFGLMKHEWGWLHEAIGPFWDDGWVSRVSYRVKAGKEARVYCCQGRFAEDPLLAAKVYLKRGARAMTNYRYYREGRVLRDGGGRAIRDKRSYRALKQKSNHGRKLEEASWIQHEFWTMQLLHEAGADIPKPLAMQGDAVLMAYLGDDDAAAPMLTDVTLVPDAARVHFETLIRNVALFLACHCIHGDLSAYNVMLWEGEVYVIDFPQMVDPRSHRDAYDLLERDVDRLCRYFRRCGLELNSTTIAADLWWRYTSDSLRVDTPDSLASSVNL
jgi:RIO kinase 1